MEKEVKGNEYVLEGADGFGQVRIANDVVARIACLAAMEVKGVASMAEDMTNEILAKVGIKTLAKGAVVDIEDGIVSVNLTLMLKFGYNIPATCEKVQGKVRSQIETMTGMKVRRVNVRVSGVTGE